MLRLPIVLNYMYLVSWSWEKTFPGGWGWVVGSAENRANSAPIELGLGLSLAKIRLTSIVFGLEGLLFWIKSLVSSLVLHSWSHFCSQPNQTLKFLIAEKPIYQILLCIEPFAKWGVIAISLLCFGSDKALVLAFAITEQCLPMKFLASNSIK